MAESIPSSAASTDSSRAPALPSTADASPYVPVSWMAVGAALVASLFLLMLLFSGYSAYKSHKPLIWPEPLLTLAALSVVLSFAARRLIRESEGTRTGDLFGFNLLNFAWWVGLIGFLGYGAYFLAIEYSISRDARSEVERWIGFVEKGEINRGFHRTLEPGKRGGINPDDGARLQGEFRDPMIGFLNTDLIRLMQRNKGDCTFVPGGLRDWVTKDTGVECVYTGTITCPEGSFPVRIPLKGFEAISSAEGSAVGRQWQIVVPQGGFMNRDEIALTDYGWMVLALEAQASGRANEFLQTLGLGPAVRPYVFHDTVMQDGEPGTWIVLVNNLSGRVALCGGTALAQPYTTEYEKALAAFLRTAGGLEPTAEKRAKFLELWKEGRGIVPAGSALLNSPDTSAVLTITPQAVVARVPVEFPEADSSASRGKLVLECTDPAVLAELQKLRAAADPSKGTREPPADFKNRNFTWKIVGVESDLNPIKPPAPPGGPGPPGG